MRNALNFSADIQHLSMVKTKSLFADDISDAMLNTLCVNLVYKKSFIQEKSTLYFSEVKTREALRKVIELRLKVYQKTNPYMLNELTAGADDYESRSSVYAAWLDGVPIATIRLTPYPFETMKYIDENKLIQFLGSDYKNNYLEWSRLLVDPDAKLIQVMPALIIYAGIKSMMHSAYTKYFGFTKPIVRRLMKKFRIDNEALEFSIPSRDNNQYLLLKGDFSNDFWSLVDKGFSFE